MPENRVYFTTSKGAADRMLEVLACEDICLGSRGQRDEYALVAVDTRKIPSMELHKDPEWPKDGVYVEEKIPASVIKVVDRHVKASKTIECACKKKPPATKKKRGSKS